MRGHAVLGRPPYRDRIAALGGIEARLDAWAAEQGEPGGPWRRVFGRLEPGRSPWAVLAYESGGGPTVAMAELEAATAAGFAAAGGSLDPGRLALHTVHKRLAKVARTAAALRPDAEERARRHLDRLTPALTALPA